VPISVNEGEMNDRLLVSRKEIISLVQVKEGILKVWKRTPPPFLNIIEQGRSYFDDTENDNSE
jgi:hypothetical protein